MEAMIRISSKRVMRTAEAYCVNAHDLGKAASGVVPHTTSQIPEICRSNLLECLLLRPLQLFDNVAVIGSLGKVGASFTATSFPSTVPAQAADEGFLSTGATPLPQLSKLWGKPGSHLHESCALCSAYQSFSRCSPEQCIPKDGMSVQTR